MSVPVPLTPLAAAAEMPGRPDVPEVKPTRVVEVTSPRAKAARDRAAQHRKGNQRLIDSARAERRTAWPKPSATEHRLTRTAKSDAVVTVNSVGGAASSRQARARAAGEVKVTVLDQKAARRAGVTGVLFTLQAEQTGAAEVTVDYSTFASAVGGNWSSRLGLATLPACALTTPHKKQCRTLAAETAATNNINAETVTARTSIAGSADKTPTVMALTAASTAAGAGDFKATPLSASATWQAGSSSGAFTWSYPITTPPAAAGPAPSLALSYDSGSIDGRTANTNNQGSMVGEGFEITSSYIERKYTSCDDDGQTDKFDLCWKYDNASLVLNGNATELVQDDTSGAWHLKDDNASKVVRLTGGDSNDENGEYWQLTTSDGTTYTFGLNKLSGAGSERTNSVWTVPVFGDDSGEPGYSKGTEFKDRSEVQAWRWNLDQVTDVHGNASTYSYAAEDNHYAKNGDTTALAPYTRGGRLEEIRYGQRSDTLFTAPASDKITFTYKERCTATNCSSLTADTADNWPDVPFDTICSASATDCQSTGPTFFTRKRLTGIDTYFWSRAAEPDAFKPVDSYTLEQEFFDGQDIGNSSDQVLTLTSLTRTGKDGTALSVPAIEFLYQQRPNRVAGGTQPGGGNIVPLTRPRIVSVTSETGAITSVTLSEPECVRSSNMPAAEDNNSLSCYPVYWAINGGETQLDWFHKYRVTSITTNDPAAGNPGTQLSYDYDTPGWHYNDDPFTKEKERTWSIWRGYQKVTTYAGDAGTTRSKNVKLFMQGMNADKRKDGTTRSAVIKGIDLDNVADNDPATTYDDLDVADWTDHDWLAGQLRQEITYNGAATAISTAVHNPWAHQTASQKKSYAHIKSYFVNKARTYSHTYLTTAQKWRTTATSYTYDTTYGTTNTVEDHGAWSTSGDETCTRTWYARDPDKGPTNLVSRTRTVAKPCANTDNTLSLPANSDTRGDVLSDTAVVYDNPAATGWSPDQIPTLGLPTWTGRAKAYPAASGTADRNPLPTTGWQTVTTTTYDTATAKLGRPLTTTDAKGRTTTTYYPAADGPLATQVVTTPKLASNGQAHQTSTNYNPARGTVNYTLDANLKRTDHTYDALGRITATWLPGRSKTADTPHAKFAYGLTRNEAPWTSVATLKPDGTSYDTTYSLYDAQLRPIQVQAPSPLGGRILTDTRYDSRGLAYETYADIYDTTSGPSGAYAQAAYGGGAQTQIQHDGAGRPTTTEFLVDGAKKWETTTTHTGDSTATSAPTGGNATRTITDPLGRTTETRTYAGTQPNDTAYGAASGTSYTNVRYTHTRDGKPDTITGPDSTTWSYTYDLFGRTVKTVDPDKGTTTTSYTDLDQIDSTTDDEDRTLLYSYDEHGRKTGLWHTSRTDTNQLAAWTYDTVLKGQPTASIRYENGNTTTGKAYTKQVTSYDNRYRPTATTLTLPADDPLVTSKAVEPTTTFQTDYRLDGSVATTREPAAAGLASELLTHRYNSAGLQTELSGTTGYLLAADYTELGQVGQLQLGTSTAEGTKRVFLTNTYERGTGRLLAAATDDQTRGPVQDLTYAYDPAGNVTAITDAANIGTGTDNQCFTYDAYRRLSQTWTPKTADCATSGRTTANLGGPAPYWTSYTYTASGQRKTEQQHFGTSATTTHCYDTARPHALTATTTTGNCTGITPQYTYDDTGNTETRVQENGSTTTQTLNWNKEGKLARLTDSTSATSTNYLYDADGELLIRRDNATDGETVLYLGATEVHLKTGKKWANRYYTAAGATIALRTNETGSEKLTFLAGDHHGTSTVAITGDASQALSKRYSTPFGKNRGQTTGVWPDDKAFLGMTADHQTGLTHIGAREYDPSTGQFISVDPLLQLNLHQTLNGYSYGAQNPATYPDPSGMGLACGEGNGFDTPCPDNDTNGDGVTNPGYPNTNVKDTNITWQDEGLQNEDANGDGYITLLPGVHIPAEWHGTAQFTQLFYGKLSESHYGIWIYADHPEEPSLQVSVSAALTSACHATGCPDEKKFFFNFFAQNVVAGIFEGGVKGRPGLGKLPKSRKGNCTQCFLAGTEVLMADGTTKDIENVRIGDKVLAADPETGEVAPRKVSRLIRTDEDKKFNELSITTEQGIEELTATYEHPFWSPSERRWVEAQQLKPGMTLLTDDARTVVVTANRPFTQHAVTYNLTIDGLHTYYVLAGQTPVLVHNSNGWCGPGLRTASEAGISPNDAKRIQNAANKSGQPIIVVGSRANGTPNAASDWDYILSGPSRTRHGVKNSLPRGTGDGEGSGRGRDFWQSYNPNRPDYAEVDRSRPYVVFEPR
ncbi:polymorphic toxin-type HINT domain-containing protein [Streptomyces cadmiisoli]|uniref:RHS repeat-associated core domain-containing protein n=1 Tax=Streptomyces cadmiisoli TaxID=2184053 RepID=A0A2Z4JCX0_9ACTN|nr:polymorphic toxin-type HINT domain-containing protein [Streptomyces cadmiisoli]AWW42152.1 RHS repeat-associated core domain-containing protein [Streptomyces cadmiisoli]AWW42989.1 RHS repeat-associated core domain-containing protein [Streptomyces cadmiisoli]